MHDSSPVIFHKIGFTYATDRAFPIIRNILKRSTGRDVSIRIPLYRVIYVTADGTAISFHLH